MTGHVYRLQIQGHTQNLPHPHVVLLELDKECWLIPAFGADGTEIAGLRRAWESMGYPSDATTVLLDNEQHVNYIEGYTGIPAYWAIERAKKFTKAYLKTHKPIGHMRSEGLLLIAKGVKRLASAKPERFSKVMLKKVDKLIESLSPPASGPLT